MVLMLMPRALSTIIATRNEIGIVTSEMSVVRTLAMYLGEGRFIHSAGRVKINSLDPSADDYLPMSCLSISRIGTRIGTPGITAVRSHPWYFDIR